MHIPSAVTESEMTALCDLARGRRVLEVGSLLGFSTVHLAVAAEVVHSVDPHEGYPQDDPRPTLQPFLTNLEEARIRARVVVHVGYDVEVLPAMREGYFDLAFIDITGLYDDTLRACELAEPLLAPSGVLAVHDCGHPEWPGAMRAVGDYSARVRRPYHLVDRLAVFRPLGWRPGL